MKFTWLTDIHINFLDKDERERFYQKIIDANCDGVLITGDIAEADCVFDLLIEMQNRINRPIYFVHTLITPFQQFHKFFEPSQKRMKLSSVAIPLSP